MQSEAEAKISQFKWLAARLRELIRAGDLKPGDRLPSWSQMQRDYGVHTSTIERAQKELAAEGLLVTRQGSGTFVAQPQNKAVRKGIIGLCGEGITYPLETSPYWARLIHGIRGAAQDAGHHILLLDRHTTQGWEKADGMLISDYTDKELAGKIPHGLPCVWLLAAQKGMCSVYADDGAGIRQSVEHLVRLGHGKIGYFHGERGKFSETRIGGYSMALGAAGIRGKKAWMREMHVLPQLAYSYDHGQQLVQTGRENMREWLREGWAKLGCTALLAHNDDVALGIIEALQEAGIRVPEDVSVIGFDGSQPITLSQPSLSTVEVPLEEIGRKGVEILLQQIEADDATHDDCILPVALRTGATTTFPPTRDSAQPNAKGV